jgi:hypothetical protein
VKQFIFLTASAICGVKTETSGLESCRNTRRNLSDHAALHHELLTTLLSRGIQIGEMSKLGWLIALVKQAI